MNKENSTWASTWDKLKDVAMLLVVGKKLELEQDCTAALMAAQKAIFAEPEAAAALKTAAVAMMEDQEMTVQEQIRITAEKSGTCRETAIAVMLINAIPLMKNAYEQTDIPCLFQVKHGCGHHPHGPADMEKMVRFLETMYTPEEKMEC